MPRDNIAQQICAIKSYAFMLNRILKAQVNTWRATECLQRAFMHGAQMNVVGMTGYSVHDAMFRQDLCCVACQ